MNKIYEAPGMMEWHPEITVGRSRVTVSFEGGHFSGRGHTPATFSTSDPALQTLLENCAHFRAGRIRLAPGYKKGVGERTVASRGCKKMRQMEFKDYTKARDHLTMSLQIPSSKLTTPEDCIAAAAAAGIELTIKS